MQVLPLASGSQGNSLLVCSGQTRLVVDIGLGLDDFESRLAVADIDPKSITAILMTHRHRDHNRGVADFCRRYRTPVYGTRRTLRSLCNKLNRGLHTVEAGQPFEIQNINVHAVGLSHDAPNTVGYRFDDGRHRFGYATDLGCDEGSLTDVFVRLDALFLEFNYDAEMLENGPYPRQLKDRIASDKGHLSNQQAATLLKKIDQDRLQRVWLAHLSQRNNKPELALAAAQGALQTADPAIIEIAEQDRPSRPWPASVTT